MQFLILAAGKPSLGYAKEGVELYLNRLRPFGKTELKLVRDGNSQDVSKRLLAASEGCLRIAMDERGELWTTRKLVEDKANGTAVIDVLKKEIPGIIPVEPFGGKVVRAHATTAVAEAGNVYIPAASACPWVMDFVEEMAAFPSGAHDDQVDCYSQANAYYNDNTFDIRSLIT